MNIISFLEEKFFIAKFNNTWNLENSKPKILEVGICIHAV